MKIEKLLFDRLIEQYRDAKQDIIGSDLTKKEEREARSALRKSLSDKKRFHSYTIENQMVIKFVSAQLLEDVWRGKHILISVYTKKKAIDLNSEIKSIKTFFKKSYPIYADVYYKDRSVIKALLKLGFSEKSYSTVGSVEDALKVVKKSKLPEDYTCDLMNYKKDIDELMKNEQLAHIKDPTSVCSKLTPSQNKEMRSYYKKWAESKNVYLVRYKNQIVAGIGFIPKNLKSYGFIGSIWVHPKHQGKGISKYMYRIALEVMLDKKCSRFGGHTSTLRVLKLSKKMKRRAHTIHLKL